MENAYEYKNITAYDDIPQYQSIPNLVPSSKGEYVTGTNLRLDCLGSID